MPLTAEERAGAIMAGFATTAVGSLVAASSLLTHYPVLSSQALRYAIAASILTLLWRRGGRPLPRLSGREAALVLALGATGLAGFNLCVLGAVGRADPAVVGVVVGCAPVLLGLAGPLLARRRPRVRLLGAAGVVAIGAALAQGSGHASGTGLALAVGALLCETLFSLLAVPLLPRLGPVVLSAYAAAAASVLLAIAAVAVEGRGALAMPTVSEALALAWLSLFVTTAAFVAWYSGVARLGVERAGLFAGLIPVAALLFVALVGTGAITPAKAAGALVVGSGILLGLSPSPGPSLGQRGRPAGVASGRRRP